MKTINEVLEFLHLENKTVEPFKGENNRYYYTYLIIPTNLNSSFYMNVYFGMKISYSIKTDNYTGSGRKIVNYINKYPNDYYKQYIGFYNNVEELQKAEYDLIHPHLNKDYCMNLKEGGGNAPLSEETKHIISEKLKGNKISKEIVEKISKTLKRKFNTPEMKERFSKNRLGEKNPMYGKNSEDYMTPEAIKEKRRKQSESMKGKNTWIKGKKHIHKGEEHILVYQYQLENYLNNGYELGLPYSMKVKKKKKTTGK